MNEKNPDGLNNRQRRFVDEYLIDLNATQAAVRAGYSAKTAAIIGHENLRKPKIAAAVEERQKERAHNLGITEQYVLTRLKENLERAMQVEAVIDREGKPSGVYVYQGAVANRAIELLGKHLGMFPDRVAMADPATMPNDELAVRRMALRRKLGLPA